MSSRGIRAHDEEQRLSMPDIVYRTLMFISENASVSNYEAVNQLIENLEDNMAPFIDKPYRKDMEAIAQLPKTKANCSSKRAFIAAEHSKKVYRMKHQALVRLAFRLGWLGNKQGSRTTEFMDDNDNGDDDE